MRARLVQAPSQAHGAEHRYNFTLDHDETNIQHYVVCLTRAGTSHEQGPCQRASHVRAIHTDHTPPDCFGAYSGVAEGNFERFKV